MYGRAVRDALYTLAFFDCYFRPGECRNFRVEDLVPPMSASSGALALCGLAAAPAERLEKSTASDTAPDPLIFDQLTICWNTILRLHGYQL